MEDNTKITVYYRRNDGLHLNVKDLKTDLRIGDKWNLIDYEDDSTQAPDLVVLGTHSKHYRAIYVQVLVARIKYGFNSFIIALSQEATNCDFPGVDYSISFLPDGDNNYYLGVVNNYLPYLEPLLNKQMHPLMKKNRKPQKKKFCNFIYSNSYSNIYEGVRVRMDFCKKLHEYKRVDCAGSNLNNTDELKIIDEITKGRWDAKFDFMKDYKFSIIFENQSKEGYITEKIWHTYVAGSIPIYWGAPDIAKYFNPQSFINCHDYESFSQVIERVKEVDRNPEMFQQYMNANPITKDSEFLSFTPQKISARLDNILRQVLTKRNKWQELKYPSVHNLRILLGFIMTNLHIVPYMSFILLRHIKGRLYKLLKN